MPRSNRLTACEDFHRTAATQRHPSVGVSRRHFLGWGVGAGLSLYTARALPLQHWMDGAEEAAAQAPSAPILVSVFLPGGLDLLDTVVPLPQYATYKRYRQDAAQPESVARMGSTGYGAHPSLSVGSNGGIRGLFDSGRIGLLPGIDYANYDLSHFHSRHFWETGVITASRTTGWLGRWLDTHGSRENPFQGLTSGFRLSPTLLTAGAPVSAVEDVRGAELNMAGVGGPALDRAMAAYGDLAAPRRSDGAGRAAVRSSARFAQMVADQLRPLQSTAPQPIEQGDGALVPSVGGGVTGYPPNSAFGARLRQLAFMLAQPLGIRVATVDANGDFDTHHSQPDRLERVLADVSASLAAFQQDLEATGLGERVLTFVWSEFGRRPRGNRSSGTDHGAGGIGWVQGMRANSGFLTEYPNLNQLDDKDNLKVTVDFRTVYASLIEQWLGTAAGDVVPDAGSLGRVQVVR